MSDLKVPIDAAVALKEQMALTEHYRNRNLLLAQAIADLQAEVEQLRAKPPAPEPTENGGND